MSKIKGFGRKTFGDLKNFYHRQLSKNVWFFVIGIFLLSRIIYAFFQPTIIGKINSPKVVDQNKINNRVVINQRPQIQMWYVWDAAHYSRLAQDYNFSLSKVEPTRNLKGADFYHQFAWFPFYPASVKIFSTLTRLSIPYSQIAVSNIFFIIALYLLYKLARVDEDDDFAKLVVTFLILMPAAFIFSAALSESSFLMLAIASFYFARKQRWWLMGLSAFLLALTRSVGFLIFIPLLVEILQQNNWQVLKKWRAMIIPSILALFSVLGLLAFMFYCYIRTGDFLAYNHSQLAGFNTRLLNPYVYVKRRMSDRRIAIILGQLLLTFFAWSKLRASYIVYSLLFTVLAVSAGSNAIFGSLRYTSFIFPVAIAAAYIFKQKPQRYYLLILFGLVHGIVFTLWSVWWTKFIV